LSDTLTQALLPELPCTGHFVRFYDEEKLLLDEVAEFIDSALRAGGTGLAIATPDHIETLRARLAGFGSAGSAGWFPGKLITLDAAETLASIMVEGWPDEERFMATVGSVVAQACAGGTVNAFGEMVALLCDEGKYEAAAHLEDLWNRLGERHDFALFCAYPTRQFADSDHAAAFQHVCKVHTHVGRSEQLSRQQSPADLHRLLAAWQQRANALEREVERRKQAERTLRRREKELADFVDNAAEGLHRVAADGTILWANRAELEMLGYAHHEYVGHHVAEFHVDKAEIDQILAALKSGATLYDRPARLRCKNGAIKHVLLNSNGCFEDGELLYTRCFTRDASDSVARQLAEAEHHRVLMQTHAEREQLLASLEHAGRAKDEFLAMLGHELRNPLSPIVTALQLLRMRNDSTTERELGIIQRQVEHLVRLVDDLLDISKIARGKIELKKERVSVSQVLAKAVEMAGPLIDKRHHHLSVQAQPGLQWEGDPVRLAQVVANLLTNAARYTDAGGTIRLAGRSAADGAIEISVNDNGSGIAEDMLPCIFDLFFQGKRNLDRAEGGLGIGLALVKSLVELHGGTVAATSEGLGRGSEFTIRLPVSSTGSSARSAARPDPGVSGAAGTRTRRILLVDDNVDGAETLASLLQAHGHDTRVTFSPLAALKLLDEFTPEVALLDIGLPQMDGYELALRLRQRLAGRPCQLIALTGYGQQADRKRSSEAGFQTHLVKPVQPDALLAAIERSAAAYSSR
jgi:PAS domain S-box-containing protein